MKLSYLIAILCIVPVAGSVFKLTAGEAPQGAPSTNTSRASLEILRSRFIEKISKPQFEQAIWGIKVISLDTDKTVFEYNAHKLLKPASNAKLYTAALALDRLGPDYQIKTSVYASSKPDAGGIIHGDLIIYGRGDPSMAPRFNYDLYDKSLKPLADAIVASGVKHIDGDLIGDESYFRGPSLGSGWNWEMLQHNYGAPPSALSVDDNVVHLILRPSAQVGEPCQITTLPETKVLKFINRTKTTSDPFDRIVAYRPIGEGVVYLSGELGRDVKRRDIDVAVNDPGLFFVTLLKDLLAQKGVTFSGRERTMTWLDREVSPLDLSKLIEIGSVKSRQVSDILDKTVKESLALYAQLLLLQVGATQTNAESANLPTERVGLNAMEEFLGTVGIDKAEAILQEGTGLSADGLVTPHATVSLLKFMSRHRFAEFFQDSLSLAGVDGTLAKRMKGGAAANNVEAKSGTLSHVVNLAGYLKTKAGERLAFSIMINNSPQPPAVNRKELDAFVEMLASFTGKSADDIDANTQPNLNKTSH